VEPGQITASAGIKINLEMTVYHYSSPNLTTGKKCNSGENRYWSPSWCHRGL